MRGCGRGNCGRYFSLRREAQGRLEEGRLDDGFCDRVPRDRGGHLLRLLDVSRLAGERIIAYLRHGFWENNVLCDLERRGRIHRSWKGYLVSRDCSLPTTTTIACDAMDQSPRRSFSSQPFLNGLNKLSSFFWNPLQIRIHR